MNTDADNTQKTTNAPALIESLTWQVNNPIRYPAQGYYPQISLEDIEAEIIRTVSQTGSVNLTDVSNLDCPEDDVYDWEENDEDTEDVIWKVSGMVNQYDYRTLQTRYEQLLDLVKTAIPFIDLAKMQNPHLNGVSQE